MWREFRSLNLVAAPDDRLARKDGGRARGVLRLRAGVNASGHACDVIDQLAVVAGPGPLDRADRYATWSPHGSGRTRVALALADIQVRRTVETLHESPGRCWPDVRRQHAVGANRFACLARRHICRDGVAVAWFTPCALGAGGLTHRGSKTGVTVIESSKSSGHAGGLAALLAREMIGANSTTRSTHRPTSTRRLIIEALLIGRT